MTAEVGGHMQDPGYETSRQEAFAQDCLVLYCSRLHSSPLTGKLLLKEFVLYQVRSEYLAALVPKKLIF